MGLLFMDQYSLLHFAVGVVSYFWGLSLWSWVVIHFVFEVVENTEWGMWVINSYIRIWPGGKPYADSLLNRFGDIIFGVLGWLVAYGLDVYGQKQGWYSQ